MSQKDFLVSHHIGGRAGSVAFPIPAAFEEDVVNCLYDADESCVAQIREVWKLRRCRTEVFPYCLAEKQGQSQFYLNYDPYTSSMLAFNEACAGYYNPYKDLGMDYLFSEAMAMQRTLPVTTYTLDGLVDKGVVPPPDFFSLDVQGAELAVLKGAVQSLRSQVLAVSLEVGFHAFYKDQALFGDVQAFLDKHDFELVDLSVYRRYPLRSRLGARGTGMVTDGEALFFKRVSAVTDAAMKNKLAFLCILFNHFEGAQAVFESSGYRPMRGVRKYLDFVADMAESMKMLPQRPFVTFARKYSYAQSVQRFSVPSGEKRASLLKNILKRAGIFTFLVHAREMARDGGKAFVAGMWKALEAGLIWAHTSWCIPGTRAERVLLAHGLREQFAVLARLRVMDSLLARRKKVNA